ncbi:MAG: response regulator transcription factor [Chitinophagales bacterium]|nr:response regulator transcription factor [Chitinophagales bacterium]
MGTIKSILIDDEPAGLKTLQLLLQKHCPQVEVLTTFSDPKRAVKEVGKNEADLIFLDIEMPGMSGFDFLQKAKDYTGKVIFVTAHSQYALRAFKFSALDYLLKPVEPEELKAAITKIVKTPAEQPEKNDLKLLAENLRLLAQPAAKKIAVSTSDSIEIIALDEVEFMKSDRNYTIIKRTGKKELLTARSLKDFDDSLSGADFIRVHSSYLININKVNRYVRKDGGYIEMSDGTQVPLSRSHRENFLNRIKA